jgi:hypothetical protein
MSCTQRRLSSRRLTFLEVGKHLERRRLPMGPRQPVHVVKHFLEEPKIMADLILVVDLGYGSRFAPIEVYNSQ